MSNDEAMSPSQAAPVSVLTAEDLARAVAEKKPEIRISDPTLAQEIAAKIAMATERRRRRKGALWAGIGFLVLILGYVSNFVFAPRSEFHGPPAAPPLGLPPSPPPPSDSYTLIPLSVIVPVILGAAAVFALWLVLRFVTSLADRGFDDIAIKYSTKKFGSGELILKRKRN